MAPSPNSKPEGPPPLSIPLPRKSLSSLTASDLPSSSPPPQGEKSPAPPTNAPSPEKPPSSPPSPPPSASPPPSKSPPPSLQSPPPTSPPPSQDPPPNQPPPRGADPPPQGGGTNPSPPQVTNPPAWGPPSPTVSPYSPAPSSGVTLPTPPGDYTSPPAPPSDGVSSPANPSGPSDSSSRPSSSSVNPNSKAPDNGTQSKSNQSSYSQGHFVRTTATIVAVGAFVVIIFVAVIFFLRWRKKRTNKNNTAYVVPSPYDSSRGSSYINRSSNGGEYNYSSPESGGGMGNSKTWFTYEELSKATNEFASQNILGTGGFGCVYKGYLQDGREVAVKKLKDNSGQGEREFKAEVEIFTRVHHRHLVSLVGCCLSENQKLLVYEYVPNNTLHHHLHASNKPVMEWALRVKVACGSARGIAYLHEDCNPRIIHRDIKSANILLDNNFEAKVADFGLAKLAQELESHSHVSTRVMGTFGYMAPEYATSGKLTEKSDVFSFGVVLLELITGRKPVDETQPVGDESLVEWARPLMSKALEIQDADELADPRLEGNYDRSELLRMIEAAAACVRHSASKRPKMTQLVHEFDTWGEPSDLNNGIKPGQSGIYDSREQSIEIRMFERMRFDSQEYPDSQASWSSRDRTD